MKNNELKTICTFDNNINEICSSNIPCLDICYSEEGLLKHLISHKHPKCVDYIPRLKELIENADYVGLSKNHGDSSFELVKVEDENILIAIKLSIKDNHLFVASIYTINETKLSNRIHSEKLKEYKKNSKMV